LCEGGQFFKGTIKIKKASGEIQGIFCVAIRVPSVLDLMYAQILVSPIMQKLPVQMLYEYGARNFLYAV
jgi:hypothetical protein